MRGTYIVMCSIRLKSSYESEATEEYDGVEYTDYYRAYKTLMEAKSNPDVITAWLEER